MLRNTPQAWGPVAVVLHWLMALLIFAQFGLGWTAVAWPLSPTKLDLFVWHKSTGLVLLVLVLVRVAWRLTDTTPALPGELPRWERHAARASHVVLYLLMIGLPLTGWLINSAANVPFRMFWVIPVPDLVAADKGLAEATKVIHLALFVTLAAVLVVHVGAALRHHFVRGNNVLVRMLTLRGGGS